MKKLCAVLTVALMGTWTLGCAPKTEPAAPAAPATETAPAQPKEGEAPAAAPAAAPAETPAAAPEGGSASK
ncbi:hypothetical protein [Planctomicrobium sp. SH527]|uniref:hypothetical protein n=1 Tax=Planctomicrobium sp. SH527 TaxID=3448123 RepID=UPI003F5C54C5